MRDKIGFNFRFNINLNFSIFHINLRFVKIKKKICLLNLEFFLIDF